MSSVFPHVARLAPALALCALAAANAWAVPKPVAPKFFIEYKPGELHSRLEHPDSVDISRACGNLSAPWGYRGSHSPLLAMRSFGRRHADGRVASALAGQLLSGNTMDSVLKAVSRSAPCDAEAGKPVYLAKFYDGKRSTFALLNFGQGHALFFDGEEPLGMVVMGASADSLWSALAKVLVDDPLLRAERPRASPDSVTRGWRRTEEPPVPLESRDAPYPPEALAARLEGMVLVWVKVGADGAVHDAYVESGQDAMFRDAALESVWQYRFKPARNKGEPVETWIAIGVGFTLP